MDGEKIPNSILWKSCKIPSLHILGPTYTEILQLIKQEYGNLQQLGDMFLRNNDTDSVPYIIYRTQTGIHAWLSALQAVWQTATS